MGASIAMAAMLVSIGSAEEIVCQGQWDGVWVDVMLMVDDRGGAVIGLVTDLGDRDRIAAAARGHRLKDGSFRIDLSYRFEHFGTFVLKPFTHETWMIWETEDKRFWFSPLGKIPPDRVPPDIEDEGESQGMRLLSS